MSNKPSNWERNQKYLSTLSTPEREATVARRKEKAALRAKKHRLKKQQPKASNMFTWSRTEPPPKSPSPSSRRPSKTGSSPPSTVRAFKALSSARTPKERQEAKFELAAAHASETKKWEDKTETELDELKVRAAERWSDIKSDRKEQQKLDKQRAEAFEREAAHQQQVEAAILQRQRDRVDRVKRQEKLMYFALEDSNSPDPVNLMRELESDMTSPKAQDESGKDKSDKEGSDKEGSYKEGSDKDETGKVVGKTRASKVTGKTRKHVSVLVDSDDDAYEDPLAANNDKESVSEGSVSEGSVDQPYEIGSRDQSPFLSCVFPKPRSKQHRVYEVINKKPKLFYKPLNKATPDNNELQAMFAEYQKYNSLFEKPDRLDLRLTVSKINSMKARGLDVMMRYILMMCWGCGLVKDTKVKPTLTKAKLVALLEGIMNRKLRGNEKTTKGALVKASMEVLQDQFSYFFENAEEAD